MIVWVKVRLSTLWAAVRALKEVAVSRHQEARLEPDPKLREERRAEADYTAAQAQELRIATLGAKKNGDDEPG